MSNIILKSALKYAKLGFKVVPNAQSNNGVCSCFRGKECHTPGKHPTVKEWTKNATNDANIITEWHKKGLLKNIGLLTGVGGGFVVIDVDDDGETKFGRETLEDLESELGKLPETLEQQTGSGGRHLLFKSPDKPIYNDSKGQILGEWIDIRGEGGQIIVAPSIHPNGREYAWDTELEVVIENLAELPQAWLDKIFKKSRTSREKKFEVPEVIEKGSRDETFFAMACSMQSKGFSEKAITSALLEENERCEEPLTEQQIIDKVKSAMKYSKGKIEPLKEPIEINADNITADTILSKDLIESLFQLDDELEHEIKYLEVLDKSKLLGKKMQFEKLYAAHKKMKKREDREKKRQEALSRAEERRTIKEHAMTKFDYGKNEYPDLYCGSWECGEDGVKVYGDKGVNIACYHPIMPIKRLTNIQTGKEKMIVAFKKNGVWKEQTFDKSTLLSANKIVNAMTDYGILISSENAKYLVKYFCEIESLNVSTIDTQRSTSKMGWFDNDFIPFVDKEKIEFDSEESFKSLYNSISSNGDENAYLEKIKEILKSKRKEPLMCMLVSLASVLVKPCGVLPFIFHLYGTGGKGKTISLMLGASIWGNPNEGGFMGDAKSTKTAFEMRLNFLNNLPLIVDDMSQVKNSISSSRNNTDFSDFIYLVCSGRGNERSNVNLGLNATTEWKNAILTNAEKPITSELSNGGEILRVIDYEVDEGNIFNDPKATADFIRSNYGFLGKEFVNSIKKKGFDALKERHKYYIDLLHSMDTQKIKEDKQLIPIALLLVTLDMLKDILNIEIDIDIKYFFDLIKTTEQMSDNERAYEFIMNEFNINRGKFAGNHDLNERWGYLKDDFILFNPNIFNQVAEKGNFNKKMFIKWALKENLTETNKDRVDKYVSSQFIKGRYVFVKNKEMSLKEETWEEVGENSNVRKMFK